MKNQKSAPPIKHRGPMGHGPNAVMQRGEKAKDFKGTIRKLIKYIGKYHLALIVVFLFAIASTVFAIIGPKVLGNATNEIFSGLMNQISGTGEGIDFSKIAGTLLTLVALYVMSALFSYIQGWIMSGISMKVTYRMRKEIEAKIQNLPLGYYDT